MEGWIKLHRKIAKWEWYENSYMVHLFIHCILKASHSDRNWQGVELKRGQFVSGINKLKKETGISVQSLRTCLDRLKLTHELTIKPTSKYSIITVCKYDSYQNNFNDSNNQINNQINKQSTNDQHEINTVLTTDKNVNNVNKEKEFEEVVAEEAIYDDQFPIPELLSKHLLPTPIKKRQEEVAIKSKTLYQDCMTIYNDFCLSQIGVKAQIDGLQGKNMKTIIAYLKSNANEGRDEDILNAWKFILSNLKKWDKFHQTQLKINQISSNLVNILNSIKNGNKLTNSKPESRFRT